MNSIIQVIQSGSLLVYPSVCLLVSLSASWQSLSQSIGLSVFLSDSPASLEVIQSGTLSVYPSVCLSVSLSVHLLVCLPVNHPVCLPFCLSTCLSVCLLSVIESIHWLVCLSVWQSSASWKSSSQAAWWSIHLSVSQSVHLSVCPSIFLFVLVLCQFGAISLNQILFVEHWNICSVC